MKNTSTFLILFPNRVSGDIGWVCYEATAAAAGLGLMSDFGSGWSAILPADLAAIPDFQSGAMENWGLTTYRETALLYDPHKSSPSDKLAITKVIAHELAHQVTHFSSF